MATVTNPLAAQSAQPAGVFDVDGARQAGYSDDDILGHLTSSRKFDVEGAVKSGYSKPDIIQYLSSKKPEADVAQVRNTAAPDLSAISRQMADNPPPAPIAPLPEELKPDLQRTQSVRLNSRTGLPMHDLPIGMGNPITNLLDSPITGTQHAIHGAEQMAQPGLRQKAGGLHKVIGGAMEAASPLMAGAAIAAPAATATTLAGATAGQAGVEAGLNALGLPPEYSALVGDLAGLVTGAALHRYTPAVDEYIRSEVLKRAQASPPPPIADTAPLNHETGAPGPPPPSKTQTISPATPNPPTAAAMTVPESPQTTAIQIQQLQEGVRRVVMFPKGDGQPIDAPPGNIGLTHDKFGNTYWYRTDLMEPGEIHRAAERNELPQLLGGLEGLGAPDKSEMPPGGPVVVARAPGGTEVQATQTTPEQLPQTIAAHEQVTPPGGAVEVTGPKEVLAQRTGGPVTGKTMAPISMRVKSPQEVKYAQPSIGEPEPIRMSVPQPRPAPSAPEALPPPIGQPEPISGATGPPKPPGRVAEFLRSEHGYSYPGAILRAMREPMDLLYRRRQMINYFKSKLPTAMEKKDAEMARRYWVGNRDWWATRVNQQIDSIRKTLTPQEQDALTFYREFRNKPGELVQFLTNSHPDMKGVARKGIEDVKPAIRLAVKPTQAIVDADKRYSDLMEIHLLLGRKMGILDSSVSPDEYVHRMFVPKSKAENGKLWDRISNTVQGGRQKRSISAQKQRSYDSILQGIADGAVPRSINALDLATLYADEYADLRATKLWENAVKAGGMGKWAIGQPEDGWVKYADGAKRFRNLFVLNDPATGEPKAHEQHFWVPEVLNDVMKPVWKPDHTAESPLFRNLQQYQGRLKGINLAFSAFHPKALEMMILSDMRNPKAAYDWVNVDFENDKWQRAEADAAMAGMPTSIQGRVVDAFRKLEPGQTPTIFDVATKLPVLKQINEASEAITRQIFDVMQRKMKIWFYATMRDRWMSEHPKASTAEIAAAKASIARFTNAKFGGLNWMNLGWTKTQLAIARFGLLAPDWFWSNVESAKIPFEGGIGATLKGTFRQAVGPLGKGIPESSAGSQAARRFWIQGLLAAGIATQILSYALTGKHSPEFTRVYEGEENGKRKMRNWFFTGAPGELVNVMNAIDDRGFTEGLAKWALGKTNALVRTGIQTSYGETYAGKKINQPDMNPLAKTIRSTGYATRSLSPIPFSVQNAWDLPQKFEPVETLKQVLSGRPAANVKIDKGNPKEGEPFWQQVMTGKASVGKTQGAAEHTQALRDIEKKIRGGESADAEIADAVKRGIITDADRLRAQKKGKLSPLEKQIKYSSAQAALRIYDQAQPTQRKEIEALVRSKVQKAKTKGWEWTDQSAELAKRHFGIDVQRTKAR